MVGALVGRQSLVLLYLVLGIGQSLQLQQELAVLSVHGGHVREGEQGGVPVVEKKNVLMIHLFYLKTIIYFQYNANNINQYNAP